MNEEINVRPLSESDDLGRVAELIYQVDPYICPDFFGDKERARKIGPVLIKNNKTLFGLKNMLVAEVGDELLGIIVFVDNKIEDWDCESVKSDILSTGIELPENFDRANKNYMELVTNEAKNLPDGIVEIELLATDVSARGKGIGGKLMDAVTSLPNYSEQHLTVLADNPGAIHLYEKKGFKVVSSQFGYPDESVKTFNMIRKNN
ncbi:GNAT family N-acetyltransferase [Candidatus Saccharibacteria bacterium]|nr:GNAT family N-acetyltransferase [Candidatus Saccharibacteria bacterium]